MEELRTPLVQRLEGGLGKIDIPGPRNWTIGLVSRRVEEVVQWMLTQYLGVHRLVQAFLAESGRSVYKNTFLLL